MIRVEYLPHKANVYIKGLIEQIWEGTDCTFHVWSDCVEVHFNKVRSFEEYISNQQRICAKTTKKFSFKDAYNDFYSKAFEAHNRMIQTFKCTGEVQRPDRYGFTGLYHIEKGLFEKMYRRSKIEAALAV
ncbi:hypothetical protein D770_05420 [Flammeovirgaceae bacterium 311]|nr:hypothetical protein D770_05420 [Flammeovirgaceae bacterium 311]